MDKIEHLEEKINNMSFADFRDVNLEGAEDNAQLGYDAENSTWVPFNAVSEDVEDFEDTEAPKDSENFEDSKDDTASTEDVEIELDKENIPEDEKDIIVK